MIRPFEYITSNHIPAGATVMPQMSFGTKFKESPKWVLKHIRKGSTGLVQSEILAGGGVVELALITDVSSIFFAAATCVGRQTFKQAKFMFMASCVKDYHMLSLTPFFFLSSGSWIWIRLGHEGGAAGIERLSLLNDFLG